MTFKKARNLKSFDQHPLVESVSDERGSGDGVWVYLRPGWHCSETGTHAVHEDSVEAVVRCFNESVLRCADADATCDCPRKG